jgi:ribonuclease D
VVREWTARDRIAQRADLSRAGPAGHGDHRGGQVVPANHAQLAKISGFAGRQARRHEKDWLTAVARARASTDDELPETTGGGLPNGLPPAHRWAERTRGRRAAGGGARRDHGPGRGKPAAGREPAVSTAQLSWDPPKPCDGQAVADALAGYAARPWQVELTAEPIARALCDLPAQVDQAAILDDVAQSEG